MAIGTVGELEAAAGWKGGLDEAGGLDEIAELVVTAELELETRARVEDLRVVVLANGGEDDVLVALG